MSSDAAPTQPDSYLKPFVLRQTPNSVGVWPLFPIYVGSNPKTFSVSLDTGSSITWLYSSVIPASVRLSRNTYDPTDSVLSCSLDTGVHYGDGLVVSFERMYLDKLHLGNTTQEDQLVFRASSVMGQSGISQNLLMEGIFALKPRYDAESNCLTVWAKMAAKLPEPAFVANLKFNDRGKYVFGTIPFQEKDVQFWDGDIEEKDFWKLPVTSYAIDGIEDVTKKRPKETDFRAMVDTGTSLLFLPPNIVHDYYAKVPGHIQRGGLHLVPSGQMLPDLTLYIGAERYPVRVSGKFLQGQGTLQNELFSLGTLQESSNPNGPILGHPFFFAQTVIFKGIDVLSVGLVKKNAEECGSGVPYN